MNKKLITNYISHNNLDANLFKPEMYSHRDFLIIFRIAILYVNIPSMLLLSLTSLFDVFELPNWAVMIVVIIYIITLVMMSISIRRRVRVARIEDTIIIADKEISTYSLSQISITQVSKNKTKITTPDHEYYTNGIKTYALLNKWLED